MTAQVIFNKDSFLVLHFYNFKGLCGKCEPVLIIHYLTLFQTLAVTLCRMHIGFVLILI